MESIGGFAEDLILKEMTDIKAGKVSPPSTNASFPQAAPAGRDISNVEVPDDFMQTLLGESYKAPAVKVKVEPEPEAPQETIEEEVEAPSLLTEQSAQELISLLTEVKGMLSEMTTCGMMGTNLAGPAATNPKSKDKKKDKKSIFKDALKKRAGK